MIRSRLTGHPSIQRRWRHDHRTIQPTPAPLRRAAGGHGPVQVGSLGQALDTTNGPFAYRDTAGATEAIVADAAGGQLALTLTSTSEAQLAGIVTRDGLIGVARL